MKWDRRHVYRVSLKVDSGRDEGQSACVLARVQLIYFAIEAGRRLHSALEKIFNKWSDSDEQIDL
jgi:hypothetical protein